MSVTACIYQDYCLSCGQCVDECPQEAIYEVGGYYCIDQEKCICGPECGIKCMEVCPTDLAIWPIVYDTCICIGDIVA